MCSIQQASEWVAILDALPAPEPGLGSSLADEVVALRRLVERSQVAYLERLAALDGASSGVVGGESTARFVAAEVGLPTRVTHRELRLARALHTDTERPCEATRALLSAGELTTPQAESIARVTRVMSPSEAQNLEPTIAAASARLAPSATDQVCRHAALVGADDTALARAERARERRHLHVSPCGDMVRIDGMVPPVEGAGLMAALDALAQPTEAESVPGAARRSRPQLMADALAELVQRALDCGQLPVSGGVRPNVHVTVDLQDLLALSGTARIEGRSQGVITAVEASGLACDGQLDWSVTNGGKPAVAAPDRSLNLDLDMDPRMVLTRTLCTG